VESRLANHPKSREVWAILESTSPASKEDVDSLIQKFREPKLDAHAIEEARARVRQLVGSGAREYLPEHAEQGPKRTNNNVGSSDFNGLGVSLDSLRALSGIGTDNN